VTGIYSNQEEGRARDVEASRAAAALLAAAALVVAACGGSDDSELTGATTGLPQRSRYLTEVSVE
jgi:hypothetical protein